MKKIPILLLILYLLSLFLPAGVQADGENFTLRAHPYFEIISAHKLIYTILFITLLAVVVVSKRYTQYAVTASIVFITNFIWVTLKPVEFDFIRYGSRYGFYVTFIIGLAFSISVFVINLRMARETTT
ncbi:hypothetical protein [Pseudolactococcus insecticola]|uniref:Uncharacterized protein n=1 Tax=Pseudolactococcus insecticola TaxID=2709158 RepID=A0A6A0B558_9LACT|nr:hypothetical protein [Lactococcus insecticola]GFH40539.1 hypothetical protein Hs20B_09370 [Lactococcus insecticola]